MQAPLLPTQPAAPWRCTERQLAKIVHRNTGAHWFCWRIAEAWALVNLRAAQGLQARAERTTWRCVACAACNTQHVHGQC